VSFNAAAAPGARPRVTALGQAIDTTGIDQVLAWERDDRDAFFAWLSKIKKVGPRDSHVYRIASPLGRDAERLDVESYVVPRATASRSWIPQSRQATPRQEGANRRNDSWVS
jgi:hypothetical protein